MYNLIEYNSKEKLEEFCNRNHIKKLAVFGSAIKGTMRSDSDIDILVEFEENNIPGLLTFCGIQNELSDIIGREVDLRTPQDLSRYFRQNVEKTAEVQYAKRR
ncbi:nucleotidyltransferase [Candidatus Desantisbacteria bacterium CG2_30_40_21]|uniref:Nucleotidyltransferase n=5 Tax=unclassified Candidatus Desantisiibacteriota TaxID=3106372 RepID=A0A2M7JAZ4_9BACT|nr:MAG: nucleotidyltransferase [Candidatus Desantisbacteria bacterium CG2_30_40_21]PIP41299.1 MAG: nucleotidyltransferase [Candidatus Desantisbacteria bacterium CG23_combo_of_CG06-09_8_20_14_all_40_23]PIX16582.1 MAG: nucleotidyltransferase [Candidatus Desantisbacteria bacterium CG_4_8_14_3_um_filter_40_12]PIY19716.1 MAG: nucleotidyltransferase [Candidatus Desantisbacteria bacterium CG_4_10_14_3_um_filter_40_18]PJB28521.1 MAG: nucleotidyltransferase [Candidatus Desantisbacteria bacterium CG_4_9_